MDSKRGPMAKLACETCRLRKSKCDERRPKCDSCERIGAQCRYRDRRSKWRMTEVTTENILKRLHRLEDQLQQERQQSQLLNPQVDWLDGVPPRIPSGNLSQRSSASELNAVSSTESFNFSEFSAQSPSMTLADDPSSDGHSSRRQPSIQSLRLADTHKGPTQVAHAHSVWLWPATLDVLKACNSPVLDILYSLQFNEISWLMRVQKPGWDKNSFDGGTATHPPATGDTGGLMNPFNYWIALSFDEIQQLSNVYFNTFNHLYPFMDRGWFFSNTLPKAMDGPRQAEDETTITLLILALGQLAQEGSTGTPIFQLGLRPSGIRGGNADLPPGFALFDKARQRIGFAVTQYSLEAVQIFSLVGLYFGQCCRYLDFWRSATAASQACQLLLSKEPISWSTPRGDQIALVYWHCVITENGLHYDLGLPQSGIDRFDDDVPFPTFIGSNHPADIVSDGFSHYRMHFIAQIALRRVYGNINSILYEGGSSPAETTEHLGVPQPLIVKEMARQADIWRESLPALIQWVDDSPSDSSPILQHTQLTFAPPSPDSSSAHSSHSSSVLYPGPFPCEIIHPVVRAQIRTRFYHVRYTIYRPYVYKVLHFPAQTSSDDIDKCVLCLKACCYWPIYMAPVSEMKRLLPAHFTWSQTILGILLIFHLTARHPLLRHIRDKYFPNNEIEETTALMVDWIQDMKEVDGVASWGWDILNQLPNC